MKGSRISRLLHVRHWEVALGAATCPDPVPTAGTALPLRTVAMEVRKGGGSPRSQKAKATVFCHSSISFSQKTNKLQKQTNNNRNRAARREPGLPFPCCLPPLHSSQPLTAQLLGLKCLSLCSFLRLICLKNCSHELDVSENKFTKNTNDIFSPEPGVKLGPLQPPGLPLERK